jgi:hypothetical protein
MRCCHRTPDPCNIRIGVRSYLPLPSLHILLFSSFSRIQPPGVAPVQQRVQVNLGGAAPASNRIVRGGGGGNAIQTSSGRTVGLKKKQPTERQSIKTVVAPASQARQGRRDAVAERAATGRDQLRNARRQQARQQQPQQHQQQQQQYHHPAIAALPMPRIPIVSQPVALPAFKLAPQFITAPAAFSVGTVARSNKKAQQQQQAVQSGRKGAAASTKKGAAGATKKGAAAAGGKAQQQKQQQRAAGKKAGSGTANKAAAANKRQPGGPKKKGAANGAAAASNGHAAAAAGPTKDSLDADMDSYMSAAPAAV